MSSTHPDAVEWEAIYARLPKALKTKLDADASAQQRSTSNLVWRIIANHYTGQK